MLQNALFKVDTFFIFIFFWNKIILIGITTGYKDNDYKIIALALLTGLDKPSKFMNPQLTGTAQNRDSMLFSLRVCIDIILFWYLTILLWYYFIIIFNFYIVKQRENNTGVKIETVANMKVAHGKDICDVAHVLIALFIFWLFF